MSSSGTQSNSTASLFASALGTGKTTTPTADPTILGSGLEPDDAAHDLTAIMASQTNTGEQRSGDSQDSSAETDASLSQDSEEGSDSEDSNPDQEKIPSDDNVEFLQVTDHQGRKVKVKVDYSDKDSIKRAFNMAAGARKWQVERDNLKKEIEGYKSTHGKKVENWDYIDNAFKEGGVEGLVNFLQGDAQAFDKLVDQKLQDREWRANASPEELALHTERQERAKEAKEIESIRKELADIKQGQASTKEEAELASLKSSINPVFDKYRFADKLGDPAKEHTLDKWLYREAMEHLEGLPEDSDITPEVISKAFKDTAQSIRSLINQQADKKVNKIVADKKRDATETAQIKAQKGFAKNGETDSQDSGMMDMLRQGRMTDMFKLIQRNNKNFMK